MKTMKPLLFSTLIGLVGTAVHAERVSITKVQQFTPAVFNLPPIDTEAVAEVGESIISSVLKGVKPAIKLTKKVEEFKFDLLFGTQIIDLPLGVFPYYGENNDGVFFSADPSAYGLLYIPFDEKKEIQVCYAPGIIRCEPAPSLALNINLEKTESDFYLKSAFKKQLIYTGGNKKEISISYREFINDLARPAFTQELKYDISDEKVIGFKGARFEVIKADNSEIKFKVLRHLN